MRQILISDSQMKKHALGLHYSIHIVDRKVGRKKERRKKIEEKVRWFLRSFRT